MKLGVFTTGTWPKGRGDLFDQPLNSYVFAEQTVYIDGADKKTYWPKEFSWELIGQQFQKGYEACSGEWVIHADLDFIFHEADYQKIRDTLFNSDAPAMSFWKYQFIRPDRYNLKSRLVIAVNKARYGDRIRFDGGKDLCQPTLDGEQLKPDDVPEAEIPIWNYECILKTKEQLLEDKGRFARAWQRKFGEYKLGGPDDESAYREWLKMVLGRNNRAHVRVGLSDHPKVMHETLKNLKPEMWGYDGFGNFEVNPYA